MTESPAASTSRDEYARRAHAALSTDNLVLAEALAQEILYIDPDDGVAWAIMAHIAALIGYDDLAQQWAPQANAEVLSGFDAPRHEKVLELLEGCGPCPDDEKFILIKAWGHGFWSDIFHLLGALLLAEITARQPCILWGDNSLFLPDGETNAFPVYFQGVGTELLMFLKGAPAEQIFPNKWCDAGIDTAMHERNLPPHRGGEGCMAAFWLLNRPERIVVSDFHIGVVDLIPWLPKDHPMNGLSADEIVEILMGRYLAPNWRIRDSVADQLERLKDRRTVAVHIQGAGMTAERSKLDEVNGYYPAVVEQAVAKGYLVWLMTDMGSVVEDYRSRFGDAVRCLEAHRTEPGEGGQDVADSEARRRIGEDIVTDTLVGASCSRFIGNGASNASCMVDFLMKCDPARVHLFLPNQNRRRFLNLYRD